MEENEASIGKKRDKDHNVYEHKRDYDMYPEMFSMKVHFGGQFTSFPGREYVGGDKVIIDWLNIDTFTLKQMKLVVVYYGNHDPDIQVFFYYKKPGGDLDFDLFPISTEEHLNNMLRLAKKTRFIEVYVEHGTTTMGDHFVSFTPNKTNNVVSEQAETSNPRRRLFANDTGLGGSDGLDGADTNPPSGDIGGGEGLDGHQTNAPNADLRSAWYGLEGGQTNELDLFDFGTFDFEGLDDYVSSKTNEHVQVEPDDGFPLDMSDLLHEVDVDMSKFVGTFQRDDVNWIGKGVESSVGELKKGEEVIGINFDEYDSGEGSDDEESKRKRKIKELKGLHQSTSSNIIKPPFYLGQSFTDKEQIKFLVKQHAVDSRRDIKFYKNDSLRIRARCYGHTPKYKGREKLPVRRKKKDNIISGRNVISHGDNIKGKNVNSEGEGSKKPTCPWALHVSRRKEEDRWMVKTYQDQHKCLKSRRISAANSTFLAEHVCDIVRSNPDISGEALEDLLTKKFEINITRMGAYRAKDKAAKKLRGDFTEQYSMLRDYIQELQVRNPDTTVKLDFEPTSVISQNTRVFRRIYVCLGALKKGFRDLGRELLGLDGAFMKGPYPGQLLTAVSVDGNNGIYPVAYALVEAECRASWEWFLECLADDLGLPNNMNFTFISDRQKGILQAINRLFPSAEHRFCLRHIHENMKAKFRDGGLREHLWFAATRTTLGEFQNALSEIQKLHSGAHDWLCKIPSAAWSRAHFSGRAKCDILLNNICESFNGKLVKGRDKPIITSLEFIREYLMKRIVTVQAEIDKCDGPLTPTATQILEANKEGAGNLNVIWNGGQRYQVCGPWNEQCVVDMGVRSCTCRKWDLTGIPCKHVIAVIWKMDKYGFDVGVAEDWVHVAYTLDTWKQVYSHKIEPIVGATYWTRTDARIKVLPPRHHTQVGRPKKKRKRSRDEIDHPIVKGSKLSKKGGTITCSKCKQKGHNAKSCKGQSSNASQKRPSKKQKKSTQASQPSQTSQATQAHDPCQTTQPSQAPLPTQASQSSTPNSPSQSSVLTTPKETSVLRTRLSPRGVTWTAPKGFAGPRYQP